MMKRLVMIGMAALFILSVAGQVFAGIGTSPSGPCC